MLAQSIINPANMFKLTISKSNGHFADRYEKVPVFRVSNHLGFKAFVYMCRLNLDIDGAPTTYGFDNPAKDSVQKNLDPLESWHKGWKGVSKERSQKVGLANAAGSPGDGTKGHRNFIKGNRKFYWAGIRSARRTDKIDDSVILDDRPELEAGLREPAKHSKQVIPVDKGLGWFPLVQKTTGYYISSTSMLADASASDSHRYLDATVVPYAVWANHWAALGVQQGDFGLAIENATGKSLAYVYGDSGTRDKVGECSLFLHDTLGKGHGYVTFIAFPGSGAGPKQALGPQAQMVSMFNVFGKMKALGLHTAELALHLAIGPDLGISKQANQKRWDEKTLAKTLSFWTTGS